jgi:5-methylcytosine-specific restriction endonuclease McrA
MDTTLSWVARLARWAHVKRAAFDTHAMAAGRPLEGVEYQRATPGYYSPAMWGRTCACCGVSGVPLNIDHIQSRSRGGSDRIANLTLACIPCDQGKDAHPVREFLADRPKVLARTLAQAKPPLRDAAAMNATRWALWGALRETGLPVPTGSGGRTKWNRSRTGAPKSHVLDALHVGTLDEVPGRPGQVLVAAGHSRIRPDRYGFPRLRLPRVKQIHGFATGDLVHAVVPTGSHAGTHTGRVAVRGSGSHTVQSGHVPVKTFWKHLRLLQRADGYSYTTQGEER